LPQQAHTEAKFAKERKRMLIITEKRADNQRSPGTVVYSGKWITNSVFTSRGRSDTFYLFRSRLGLSFLKGVAHGSSCYRVLYGSCSCCKEPPTSCFCNLFLGNFLVAPKTHAFFLFFLSAHDIFSRPPQGTRCFLCWTVELSYIFLFLTHFISTFFTFLFSGSGWASASLPDLRRCLGWWQEGLYYHATSTFSRSATARFFENSSISAGF